MAYWHWAHGIKVVRIATQALTVWCVEVRLLIKWRTEHRIKKRLRRLLRKTVEDAEADAVDRALCRWRVFTEYELQQWAALRFGMIEHVRRKMVWHLQRWLLKARAKADPNFDDYQHNLRSFVQFEARQKRMSNPPKRATGTERRKRVLQRNSQLLEPKELRELDAEFDQVRSEEWL